MRFKLGFMVFLLFFIFLTTSVGACWTENNFRGMVYDATKLTPDNLQWVMNQYQDSFQRGLQKKTSKINDREAFVKIIVKDSQSAIKAFSTERSFSKGAVYLGKLARTISDLHRVIMKPGTLSNPNWVTDYAIYLQQKRSFFRIRWKGIEQRPKSSKSLLEMLQSSNQRISKVSTILTDTLNKEKKEISSYDVRSAPFGIGCIAYSSAVNTIAMTWLYVWENTGGIQGSSG